MRSLVATLTLDVLTVPAAMEVRDSVHENRLDLAFATYSELMQCPHCKSEVGVGTVTLAEHAFMLRIPCEKCGREFLIVDGVAMTEEQYSSHPPPRKGT